jgi:hypothetical protein
MLSDNIILLCHTCLFLGIVISPFVNDCDYKRLVLILLSFLLLHFYLKYGKCMLINFERFFLGEKFKEGFIFRLIKPVICYKRNIFYKDFYYLIVFYCVLLYIQLKLNNCNLSLFQDFELLYKHLMKN